MPRILLVEDEIGAIAALKRVLSRGGFDVLVTTNSADALSLAQNEQPAALVLSGELQSGQSASLYAALSSVLPLKPVVLLGGGDSFGVEGLRLPRPVDGAELVELLHTALSAERAQTDQANQAIPEQRGAAPQPGALPDGSPVSSQPQQRSLAARRELQAARELAEQTARTKAAAMIRAAEARRLELQTHHQEQPIAVDAAAPAPRPSQAVQAAMPASPARNALASKLFDDLEITATSPGLETHTAGNQGAAEVQSPNGSAKSAHQRLPCQFQRRAISQPTSRPS